MKKLNKQPLESKMQGVANDSSNLILIESFFYVLSLKVKQSLLPDQGSKHKRLRMNPFYGGQNKTV